MPLDISGKRFGKLVAIKRTKKYRDTYYWLFKCDCGQEKEILLSSVTRKKESTESCGCVRRVATEHLGSAQKVNFIRNGLRGLWQKWPPRYFVRHAAYVETKINDDTGRKAKHYKCAHCNLTFPQTKTSIDHIVPVGSLRDWNEHIEKLFCPASNLQLLCNICHKIKTKKDNSLTGGKKTT